MSKKTLAELQGELQTLADASQAVGIAQADADNAESEVVAAQGDLAVANQALADKEAAEKTVYDGFVADLSDSFSPV